MPTFPSLQLLISGLIAAFEELDWDTEYEVEGKDPLWDEAYSKSNSTSVD